MYLTINDSKSNKNDNDDRHDNNNSNIIQDLQY